MHDIVGWSLSECMCRTLISRMHMTVNRMWLSIAKPQATEYDLYFVYSTHTCTTQELSQASSSSPAGTSHTAYMTAIAGPAHHDMVLAGYVQVAWAEGSLAILIAIEEVGLRDKWPQHRKWWESGIHIQISTEIFAALQQPLLPLE